MSKYIMHLVRILVLANSVSMKWKNVELNEKVESDE